ncbi:MAG: sulfite exporter TauE/SafE family protein [Moraxellaceae bacterium]|nr:sulfite exporter TauE/SafE family protein [Moraxellaceae bacterium]
MTMSVLEVVILLASGLAAGFVNTIAGGGGLFTLAALLFMGLPADVANGTNRVSVALQSVEGVRGFHRHGKLDTGAILPILWPTLFGSLIGSVLASYLPVTLLKPLLLSTMMGMALLMILKPAVMAPPADAPAFALHEKPLGWAALFGAGLYGGFIQGGVGFLLLGALVGVLRYQLVQANALKLVCTGVFGVVALSVFALRGQVLWIPGLIIAAGTLIGVRVSVDFAVKAKHETLRVILLVAVVGVCVASFFR